MKKLILILMGIGAVAASLIFRAQILSLMTGSAPFRSYESVEFGISFRYPESYFLEEREVGDAHRRHYLIMLTDDTEENRLVREGKSPGRDGPVAITFDIYQNNLDSISLENWLKATDQSNFKLSDGNYQKAALAGVEALSYRWSGLYEADAAVFRHRENIIAGTVTYIRPDEKIRADFTAILNSLNLK